LCKSTSFKIQEKLKTLTDKAIIFAMAAYGGSYLVAAEGIL
jgi:hypothetical protein